MQVTLENTSGLERRLKVEIAEDQVSTKVDERLTSLTQTARIPGFRPGKVPLKIVTRRFGKQVREEVVGELIRSTLFEAIAQENLNPAGAPAIEPVQAEPGQGVTYTAVFDVYPEIELSDPTTLKVQRCQAEVQDADVDRMLETLRAQRKTWEEVTRAAATDDRVVVDYEGKVDGEPLDKGQATDAVIEIGAKRMIAGFEEGLIGATAGEDKTLDLTFPDDYPAEEIAGKAVSFQVKIKRVEASSLPELNDEFASAFGVSEGGVEALRKEVRKNMEGELAQVVRNTDKRRVMDALHETQTIEVPEALVKSEAERALERQRAEMARAGMDPSTLNLGPEMFEAEARRRVSLGLLLAEVVKKSELTPDATLVRERIEAIGATYEDPSEVVRWYYGDPERTREIESSVLEDQVVDWLLERAQVTVEQSSFDELMNPGQTNA